MKLYRIVCPFLSILLCSGCMSDSSAKETTHSHQEIGESIHDKKYEDDYVINVTYPKTRIEVVDEQIADHIQAYEDSFLKQIEGFEGEHKAELNIDYQSYVKDDRYVSIKLDVFQSIDENKEEIVTLVYDQKEEVFVHIDSLFDEDAIKRIGDHARAYFKEQYPDECNTTSFQVHSAGTAFNYDTFVLRRDAIVFYFQEGYLFDKSTSFALRYDDIQEHTDFQSEELAVFVPYEDILNEPVKNIDPNQPMIALTFDDGPTKKYTSAILDALKENQSSATFFVLGSRASDFPEILQRMILEGNEIGNHTYSHKQLTTLSKENIEEEIAHTQESIHDVTNHYPNVIRPPYGSKNDDVMKCADGKKIVTWSLDTEDWRSKNTEAIVNKVLHEVKDGDIILMHDLYASTAEAAIILIPKLKDMGYQLVTVSDLYEYGKNDAGKIM